METAWGGDLTVAGGGGGLLVVYPRSDYADLVGGRDSASSGSKARPCSRRRGMEASRWKRKKKMRVFRENNGPSNK